MTQNVTVVKAVSTNQVSQCVSILTVQDSRRPTPFSLFFLHITKNLCINGEFINHHYLLVSSEGQVWRTTSTYMVIIGRYVHWDEELSLSAQMWSIINISAICIHIVNAGGGRPPIWGLGWYNSSSLALWEIASNRPSLACSTAVPLLLQTLEAAPLSNVTDSRPVEPKPPCWLPFVPLPHDPSSMAISDAWKWIRLT